MAGMEAVLEADVDDGTDSYYTGDLLSQTTSIASSIMDFRKENGRTYHKYKDGSYVLPNDELEKGRLNLQHNMSLFTLDGKLHLAPIPDNVKRVLDVGTGTGIWVIEFADQHPNTTVLGNDLSPIQPTFIPANVMFEIDDAEAEWTYAEKFDFIYARMMLGAFKDWPRFFEQCFAHTTPGGYLELHDMEFPIRCDDGTLTENHAVYKWSENMREGMRRTGQYIDITHRYKEMMEAAGYQNVQQVVHKWAMSPWPKAAKEKKLGLWERHNFIEGLPAFTLAIFTRILGWTRDETEVLMKGVRDDIMNKACHAYFNIYTIYGQKPATT